METDTIGGSELTTPAQATVSMFSRSKPGSVPQQETSTAGSGARNVVAPMARNAVMNPTSLLSGAYAREAMVRISSTCGGSRCTNLPV